MRELYKQKKWVWGEHPDIYIKKGANLLVGDTVLDLGVGDGRNAIRLAKLGFNVTGVDRYQEALDSMMSKAEEMDLGERVIPVQADLETYEIDETYDNIICNFTLHFLKTDKMYELLENIQQHTKPGGINIISDFVFEKPANDTRNGLAPGELQSSYSDWEVVHFFTKQTGMRKKDKNGNPQTQQMEMIFVRKADDVVIGQG